MLPPDSARSDTLYLTPATPLRLVSRKVRVEIVGGPDAGKQSELPGPEVRIGSAPGCDLVVRDPTVSRVHLTLRVDGDRIRIIDAGSTNGTMVDGLAIKDAFARPDSRIHAGNTTLRLAMLPDVVEIPISMRDRFGSLFGRSEAMRRVFAVLERVAPTDTTVLVEGETGTGKELVAEGLHEESQRSTGPFVVFDCSAVSPNLIESELFGHVKGAFTGAFSDRAGAFEAADGGTLFLDEVGELPLDLQPKLLRALERREVRRIGSNHVRKVDVRIIAATNRSLNREVERGRFREDLYYRLAVINVNLPPLRERPEDIPLLIQHFMVELGGAKAAPLPEAVVKSISNSTFPGNVRELRNLVARALSLRPPVTATASNEPLASIGATQPAVAFTIDLNVPLKIARDRVIDQFEQAYLREALALTSGNVTRAADLAGVNRKFIQRAMARLGLRGNDCGADDDLAAESSEIPI
jgi:transcriptional regulator with GAF, ATPase, and Fis domain